MKTRPASVTIIGWYIIVSGAFTLPFVLSMLHNPMMLELVEEGVIEIPDSTLYFYALVIIGIVSGVFMLKGHNWSRFVYAVNSAAGLSAGFFVFPRHSEIMPGFPMWVFIIPGFITLGVILFFLFRPRANDYFLKRNVCPDCREVMDADNGLCSRCARADAESGKKTSPLAIAALVFSVVGLLSCLTFMGGILGLIFGYKGRTEVKASGGALEGMGIARAGIIISWIAIAKDVVFSVVWAFMISHIGKL